MTKKNKTLVSIIITTKNEEEVIKRLLNSLEKQNYLNREIIVIDNYSTDNTSRIAKRFTKDIYNKGPERSAQRNYGAKKAKGEYLLFLDADMKLSEKVVKECVDLVNKKRKVGAITIPEESIAKTLWEKVKAFERSFYNLEGDEITDAARFFKKDVFEKVNGYDESITGPEDWDLTDKVKKAGYKIGRISALIYHYERVPNPIKLAKKKYYYGLKSHRYLVKHNISLIGPKTIYFLRPVFLRNINKIFAHPILAALMVLMLSFEMAGGGMGYIVGKIKKL
jgi:glycosyltransferase involved in cell wall biosynthesis